MALARAAERHLLPLFARGTYDRWWTGAPGGAVEEAFEIRCADRNVGKIVLTWSGR